MEGKVGKQEENQEDMFLLQSVEPVSTKLPLYQEKFDHKIDINNIFYSTMN